MRLLPKMILKSALLMSAMSALAACNHGAGSAAAAVGGWQEIVKTDALSGEKTNEAEAKLTADDGESFDLSAQCTPGFFNFTLTDYKKGAKFETGETQGGDEAYFLRTKLDNLDVANARSDVQYTNEASVFFYDPEIALTSISSGVAGNYGKVLGDPSGAGDKSGIGGAIGGLAAALSAMAAGPLLEATAAGKIDDLEKGSVFKIEVPMAGGTKSTLTINLKDAGLQSFIRRCHNESAAKFPKQTASENASAPVAGAPAPTTTETAADHDHSNAQTTVSSAPGPQPEPDITATGTVTKPQS